MLIEISNTTDGFQLQYLSWLITLFWIFLVWDVFKIKEHYEKGQNKRNNRLTTSFIKTLGFAVLFTIIGIVNPHTVRLSESIDWIDNDMRYVGIMFLSILLVIAYRWVKWSMYIEPRTKPNTRS